MRTLYFVINPNAQSGQGWGIWKEIELELKKNRIDYHFYATKRPKDGIRIARKLTSGKKDRTIILLGGDGTLNEFLNGMERTKGIYLGYLPIGSGNDFANGMEISKNYKKQLYRILYHPRMKELDYGVVRYTDGTKRRFFVSAGVGYDADVCHGANHSRLKKILNRFHLGKLIYILIGIKNIIAIQTFSANLEVDGQKVLSGDDFILTSFQNLPNEGGGVKFAPSAKPDDGYLNVCVAKGIPKWKIPFLIPLALVGKHVGHKGVYQLIGKEMHIHTKSGQYVHTDGETKKKETDILISVSNEKVKFFI